MSICPYTGSPMGLFREFEPLMPYWAQRMNMLNNFNNIVPQHLNEVEDNENKFAVKLDVAAFKPEELKVNLEGNILTIEGHHEVKTKHGSSKRSFTRQITLPKNVDLAHIHTAIDNDGQMTIDVPKTGTHSAIRAIPIHTSSGHAVTQGNKPTNTTTATTGKH